MLEQLLHGDVLRLLHARSKKSNEKRQPGAGNEINERVSGLLAIVRFDLAPAETLPEGVTAQEGQRNVEEKEDGGVPDEHAPDSKLRLGDEVLFHLFCGEFLAVRQIVDCQNALHHNQAYETKKDEEDEMRPRPGDLQIFRVLR